MARNTGILLPYRGAGLYPGRLITRRGEVRAHNAGEMPGSFAWWKADRFDKLTIGSAMRAAGTSPPTVTISGSPARDMGLRVRVTSTAGGTALGQALIDWSENNGTTYTGSPVVSAASVVLGTTGYTIAMGAGTYNTDQTWDALPATVANILSGTLNLTSRASPVILTMGALNTGMSAWDFGTTLVANKGFSIDSFTVDAFSIGVVLYTTTSFNGYVYNHGAEATGRHMFSSAGPSIAVANGTASRSLLNINSTWLRNSVRKLVVQTWDASGHSSGQKAYRNGVRDFTTPVAGFDTNPGPGPFTATGTLGCSFTGGNNWRGWIAEVIIADTAWTDSEVWHLYNLLKAEHNLSANP